MACILFRQRITGNHHQDVLRAKCATGQSLRIWIKKLTSKQCRGPASKVRLACFGHGFSYTSIRVNDSFCRIDECFTPIC